MDITFQHAAVVDFPVCSDPASVLAAYSSLAQASGNNIGGSVSAKPRPYRRLPGTRTPIAPACVQVAITVQFVRTSGFPRSLLVPCVISRSITTKRDRLLRKVVRRLYSRRRNEPEVTCTMLLESGRHVRLFLVARHVGRGTMQNLESGQLQLALELFRREVVLGR